MTSKNSKTPSDKTAARPDLRRLAEHLGVSPTTVSRVLNGAAIGAITVLHEAGIQVPEQVSVVGFDDILSAATNNPRLTTVRQPLQEMGRAAASTLLQMINNERQAWPKHPIRVLPTFVERQSTATVRQDRKSAPSPVLSVSAFTQR
jgi:DNA-binding LacI/PurR family transcriptional regulator